VSLSGKNVIKTPQKNKTTEEPRLQKRFSTQRHFRSDALELSTATFFWIVFLTSVLRHLMRAHARIVA
jgi:hypothetical protein